MITPVAKAERGGADESFSESILLLVANPTVSTCMVILGAYSSRIGKNSAIIVIEGSGLRNAPKKSHILDTYSPQGFRCGSGGS